ncbi:hypothetical protein BH11PLA1_BH11PLA1_03330 [soil metagenome]
MERARQIASNPMLYWATVFLVGAVAAALIAFSAVSYEAVGVARLAFVILAGLFIAALVLSCAGTKARRGAEGAAAGAPLGKRGTTLDRPNVLR